MSRVSYRHSNGYKLNRILDNAARALYAPVIEQMMQLVPEMMSRKIPEASVQQAFVLDTVLDVIKGNSSSSVLCIGSFEDTACESLKMMKVVVEDIDPALNYDLDTFMKLPSTYNGSYEIVFSTSVLEHVRDDARFVSNMVDLLAPGGIGILTFDYLEGWLPGMPIFPGNFRFYEQHYLKRSILPLLHGCVTVDEPHWDCPNPDFLLSGLYYTFGTLVFEKLKS